MAWDDDQTETDSITNTEWNNMVGYIKSVIEDEGIINAEQVSIKDSIVVSPDSHPTLDDIIDEMNEGKSVIAMGGDYTASLSPPRITDGSLYMQDNSRIVVPSDQQEGWLVIGGNTISNHDITENLEKNDREISIGDTSDFEEGMLVLISDDNPYFSGSSMDTGEVGIVETVVDGTTLRLKEGVEFAHSTTDTISISANTYWTGTISGGVWDFGNVDHDAGGGTAIKVRQSIGGQFINTEISYKGTDRVEQIFEVEDAYNFELRNIKVGQHNANGLGLFAQLGTRTRYATMRNIKIYGGGFITEYEHSGTGPCLYPRHYDILVSGHQVGEKASTFYVNPTVIGAVFDGLEMYDAAHSTTVPHIRNRGKDTSIRNVNIRDTNGYGEGIRMDGIGGTISNYNVRGTNKGVMITAVDGNGHPDAGSEPIFINDINIDVAGDEGLYVGNMDENILPKITVNGGYINADLPLKEVEEIVLRNLEIEDSQLRISSDATNIYIENCEIHTSSSDFLRETESVNLLKVSDVTVYNITGSSSFIRVEEFDTVVCSNVIIPKNKSEVSNYLIRTGTNVSTLRIDMCDGRNTGLAGFRIDDDSTDVKIDDLSLGSTAGSGAP